MRSRRTVGSVLARVYGLRGTSLVTIILGVQSIRALRSSKEKEYFQEIESSILEICNVRERYRLKRIPPIGSAERRGRRTSSHDGA